MGTGASAMGTGASANLSETIRETPEADLVLCLNGLSPRNLEKLTVAMANAGTSYTDPLRQLFASIDTDGSGCISRTELAAKLALDTEIPRMLESFGGSGHMCAFEQLDVNKDSKITWDEFVGVFTGSFKPADTGLDDGEPMLYFAIGSMVNPTSLAGRNLKPLESRPAELLNYELVFMGKPGGDGGMAFAKATAGKSFHGVLHTISQSAMVSLDAIEQGYDRVPAEARLYNGQTVSCTVYAPPADESKKSLFGETVEIPPPERYRDIILEGYKIFGVAAEQMKWLEEHPMIPRIPPHDFKTLEMPTGLPNMTMADVEKMDGNDGRKLMYALNGKVLVWDAPQEGPMYEAIKGFCGGKDVTFLMACNKYDPKYGMPGSMADMSAEHKASIEDAIMRGVQDTWKPAAWLVSS